jgi:hypothetical protein
MNVTDTALRPSERQRASVARRLAVAWQHPATRQISPVALLEFDEVTYRFFYIRNAATVEDFRPLLGFSDLYRTYESPHLFPLFAQRVMDPRRPDHSRYVHRLGLQDDASPWEQMTRSGGRREGDLLQLFPEPEVHGDGSVSCSFLVHGIRHVPESNARDGYGRRVTGEAMASQLARLRTGQALELLRDLRNPVNNRAVITATPEHFPLGWVPNLLLDDLYAFSDEAPETLHVSVQQINDQDAPPHLRLLAHLTAHPTRPYQPFAGHSWERLECSSA